MRTLDVTAAAPDPESARDFLARLRHESPAASQIKDAQSLPGARNLAKPFHPRPNHRPQTSGEVKIRRPPFRRTVVVDLGVFDAMWT